MSNSNVDIGLVQQLDSARADIQFLSKNHAETLKGLHSEIKSLQQSNRELQFQLTFAKTNDELQLKINQLEKENTKYKSKMNEMVRALYCSMWSSAAPWYEEILLPMVFGRLPLQS